jgi:hypothetical protein
MIFDTTALDNQIAKLTAERDRQSKLNELATQCLSQVADLIDELDEGAIAILKAEVLGLFPDEEPETIDTPDEDAETISDRVREAKGDYFSLTPTTNPALAYLKRRDGQLGCVYLGGMSQARLQAWGDWLYANGYVGATPTPRSAKRLTNWSYELKLPPIPLSYLEELVATDFTRYPSMPRFTHSVLAA